MRYGLSVYDIGAADLVELAVAAEAVGFETLWLGEHLLMPADYGAVHPTREPPEERARRIVGPDTVLVDPLVALAAAAARTERLTLATGIYVLPLRHPLAVARATLSLHELSAGRFVLGVGTGWLEEEFAALGVPFAGRGRRVDESLAVLRAAWAGGVFEHHGEVYDFGPVQLTRAAAHIPLVLGGNSAPALRRAARWADGWFASGNPSTADAVGLVAALTAARRQAGREGSMTTYVRVSPPRTAELEAYEEAGVDQLVFWAHELCPPGRDRWSRLAEAAAGLGLRPAPPPAATPPVTAGRGPNREEHP